MKILIIGTGKMGFSIMSAWNRNNFSKPLKIYAVDKSKNIREKVEKKFKKVIVSEEVS